MESLLSPEGGLAGVALASFLAATIVPLSSEVVLFGYLRLHPEMAAPAIGIATACNTLGGMTTYLIGRLIPARKLDARALDARALAWLRRYGAAATFFAWLPVLGDALCAAAGWLRLNWIAVLGCMAAGRLARYLVVAAL